MKKRGKGWKAPVIHLNDSQTGLVAFTGRYIWTRKGILKESRPAYEIDPVLEKSVIAFSTHTYLNRGDYPVRQRNAYGEDTLTY